MSGEALRVFRGLPIPAEYAATMKYALLAKSNGGKTYTLLKLEEQMCDLGMYFVTLDPVGKHWALRAGADGSEKGGKNDVWVLGGQHGDTPLEPKSGALIADTVIEHPGRYVLDVSTFETDADQDAFARDFAVRLFRRKAKDPGFPLLLALEEAESFIPQMPRPNQAQMLGAFGRIARQGRNHGLGLAMVAQRTAALNKGVLSQADVLVVKQMSHKRDRDAVDDWVESNGTREERDTLMASLASLEVDEAWVWSPAWLGCFTRTKVLARVTFDSSASVRHGQHQAKVELTALDVQALGKAIASTAEQQKANDPAVLRKRLRDLEEQLAKRPSEHVEVVKPVMPDFVLGRMVDAEGQARALMTQAKMHFDQVVALRADVADMDDPAQLAAVIAASVEAPATPTPAPAATATHWVTARDDAATNGSVSAPQQRILDAVAWFEAIGVTTPKRTVVAAVAGVSSKSSGFRANVSTLSGLDLVTYPGKGHLALTDSGRAGAAAPAATPTTEQLHDEVCRMLSGPQADLLRVLIGVYPGALTREELASRAGVSASSSGFRANVSTLSGFELVRYPTRGEVAASDLLFP